MAKIEPLRLTNEKEAQRFIIRTSISTLVVSVVVFIYTLYFNWRWGTIYLVVSVLTTANFYLLYEIIKRLFFPETRVMLPLLVVIKFGVVWGGGILFLVLFGFNLTAFLTGFNTLFIVILVRLVGAYFLQRTGHRP